MSATCRRSTIALLLAVSIVVGTLVVGGAAGLTATEPAPAQSATPTETGAGASIETGTVTTTETATETEPGPVADGADEQDLAFLRVAHVSPDAPPVDVYVDGERVLADASFGEASDYLTLPAGEHAVRIAPAGENDGVIFEGNFTLEPRAAMTLFAAGEVGENATESFVPVLFEDDAIQPADDEAAVSVAHMSPDAPAVDVTADGGSVVLAENVSFGEASQYATVPAGDLAVEVRPATETNDGPVVATANVSMDGGTVYSAIAIGYANGDQSADKEALRVEPFEDASNTIHLPSGVAGEAGTGELVDETPTEEPADGEAAASNETAAGGSAGTADV